MRALQVGVVEVGNEEVVLGGRRAGNDEAVLLGLGTEGVRGRAGDFLREGAGIVCGRPLRVEGLEGELREAGEVGRPACSRGLLDERASGGAPELSS